MPCGHLYIVDVSVCFSAGMDWEVLDEVECTELECTGSTVCQSGVAQVGGVQVAGAEVSGIDNVSKSPKMDVRVGHVGHVDEPWCMCGCGSFQQRIAALTVSPVCPAPTVEAARSAYYPSSPLSVVSSGEFIVPDSSIDECEFSGCDVIMDDGEFSVPDIRIDDHVSDVCVDDGEFSVPDICIDELDRCEQGCGGGVGLTEFLEENCTLNSSAELELTYPISCIDKHELDPCEQGCGSGVGLTEFLEENWTLSSSEEVQLTYPSSCEGGENDGSVVAVGSGDEISDRGGEHGGGGDEISDGGEEQGGGGGWRSSKDVEQCGDGDEISNRGEEQGVDGDEISDRGEEQGGDGGEISDRGEEQGGDGDEISDRGEEQGVDGDEISDRGEEQGGGGGLRSSKDVEQCDVGGMGSKELEQCDVGGICDKEEGHVVAVGHGGNICFESSDDEFLHEIGDMKEEEKCEDGEMSGEGVGQCDVGGTSNDKEDEHVGVGSCRSCRSCRVAFTVAILCGSSGGNICFECSDDEFLHDVGDMKEEEKCEDGEGEEQGDGEDEEQGDGDERSDRDGEQCGGGERSGKEVGQCDVGGTVDKEGERVDGGGSNKEMEQIDGGGRCDEGGDIGFESDDDKFEMSLAEMVGFGDSDTGEFVGVGVSSNKDDVVVGGRVEEGEKDDLVVFGHVEDGEKDDVVVGGHVENDDVVGGGCDVGDNGCNEQVGYDGTIGFESDDDDYLLNVGDINDGEFGVMGFGVDLQKPFVYLMDLPSLVTGAKQKFRVRGFVIDVLGKLHVEDGKWVLMVKINDGSCAMDCYIHDAVSMHYVNCIMCGDNFIYLYVGNIYAKYGWISVTANPLDS